MGIFLPTPENTKIGTRIHADGSPATGFEVLNELNYDLTECTQSHQVLNLGTVDQDELEKVVKGVLAPQKSLITVVKTKPERSKLDEGKQGGVRRRIQVKNCQTWVMDVVRTGVERGIIEKEILGMIEAAPKN